MRKILLLLVIATIPCTAALPAAGQHTLAGPVALAWENRFSPGVDSEPRALAVSPDGGVVYVAVQVGFSSSRCRVSAHDAATGAELWAVMEEGVQFCIPWSLTVSADGVLYMAGVTGTADPFVRATLLKAYVAATGTGRWSVVYEGPGDAGFVVVDLELSPGGSRLYLAGSRGNWLSGSRVASFDAATGGLLWEIAYPILSIYGEHPSALAVSPEGGRIYVTGTVQSGDDKNDILTLAFDAATGAQLWETRYEGPADSRNYGVDAAVSPDGAAVFVAGGGYQVNGYDALTTAYDAATGAEIWVVSHNGPANDYDAADALAVSKDGRTVFVAGTSTSLESNRDFAIFAYDAASGAVKWRVLTDRGGAEQAVALAASPDGGALYVTGYTYPLPASDYDPDFLTLAYATTTGAELWSARYQGTGSKRDLPAALAVSPAGNAVYVTGASETDTSFAVATLAYRAGTPPMTGPVTITGGGWFNSPAGALPSRPSATGKAHLVLNARFSRQGPVPAGQMSFRFGPLNFRSESYDRLTAGENRASLQGRGKLQGAAGEHSFLVSMLDAPPGRRGGGDRIRVKIWNTMTGQVVYDSQPGAPHDTPATTPLGGGEIVIHEG